MTGACFPRSVLSVSRQEFGKPEDNPHASGPPLQLEVIDGSLPADIYGHVYIVGPVGSVAAEAESHSPIVRPSQDGTTLLYNGEGMVYRLDFDALEQGVSLTTRIMKTPCYYADLGTFYDPKYQGSQNSPDLRFKNLGISRVSGRLGLRNQLNTAFLPVRFAEDSCDRLLVTWDMGRPYELDPVTLEAVTPIGRNDEWKPATKLISLPFEPPPPFQAIQTAAHPCFDPNTDGGQVVTTNTGRSLSNLLSQIIPIVAILRSIAGVQHAEKSTVPLETAVGEYHTPVETLWAKLKHLFLLLLQFLRAIVEFFFGNFLDIIIWDGKGDFKKWRIHHNGRPIKIKQTTHQIGLTEDYIVVIDTAFKVSIEELLPYLKSHKAQQLEAWARKILDHPQLANNDIYIIRRQDLKEGTRIVEAKKAVIPYEAAHFSVDYKNPDDQIMLHFSHVCAWDAGECISMFDFDEFATPTPALEKQRLYGVLYGPTDISRLGCWTINGRTGEVGENPQLVMDLELTWGPAIASYRTTSPYGSPDLLEDIYWGCLGCWDDLLFPHILSLYQNYPYREVGLNLIQLITKEGRKSNLLRLQIKRDRQNQPQCLSIAKSYQFDKGYYVTSPQFVPSNRGDRSTDGYIVCIVHYGEGDDPQTNGNEIWIFDAQTIEAPICKLAHPQMNIGFTVHATWLEKAQRRTAEYCIPVKEDYQPIVEKHSKEIQDLFQEWVYPQKELPVG
ncbi:MAG: hypothetical protein F6K32_12550 [Desertifilum sp. SIO1I2]|nr:hypothetical protein [Desertifilum sp. SIO1I2]